MNDEKKVVSLTLRENLINLAETMIEREIFESLQRTEAEIEKESLRNCESSLVISWLGTGVARALRMNSSEPMAGWKGAHPLLVGWMQLVIDKYSHTL